MVTKTTGVNGVRRWLGRGAAILGVTLALWTGGAAIVSAAQAQPPAARDGFVPVDELPPQEKMPAATFLMAAYSIVWLALTGYVWTVWNRLGKVEQELAHATKPSGGRGR